LPAKNSTIAVDAVCHHNYFSRNFAMTRNRQVRRTTDQTVANQNRPAATSSRRSEGAADRKTLQLCRQVEQTLHLVLSGECPDEVIQSLLVESVTPAPNASQLLVSVRQAASDEPVSTSEILARLAEFEGPLRFAVASAITRKRAPKLLFQVL